MLDDTIVGISTAYGGAITLIRMSGIRSLDILRKVFSWKDELDPKSHRVYYGWIKDGKSIKDGESADELAIDEVLVTTMLAPKTFTREDVVEISCHGGGLVTQKILLLLIRHGARLGMPGEFTKRAFLNGRINLSQAEAVMDIINAKSNLSHKAAISQLKGRLGVLLDDACNSLLSILARIEMAIDYPEHEEADIAHNDIAQKLEDIMAMLNGLADTAITGRFVRDGISVAIIGRPNVGKSSLYNALAQDDRAIVTHIPGTTRDVLREGVKIGDAFLKLADTAGIRDTDDFVESQGISRSIDEAAAADLVLFVIDGSMPFDSDDALRLFDANWQNAIIIINKCDLPHEFNKGLLDDVFKGRPIIEISAKAHIGIDALGDAINKMFLQGHARYGDDLITNSRHIALIDAARESLVSAYDAIEAGVFIDLVAIDISAAYGALGEITGIVINDELIDKIFSEFCLGK